MPPSGTSISTASIPYLKAGRNIGGPDLIIPAGRIWRPRNVLQYLPRHAWQLGDVGSDPSRFVVRGLYFPLACFKGVFFEPASRV
jgi:hypothetical protein